VRDRAVNGRRAAKLPCSSSWPRRVTPDVGEKGDVDGKRGRREREAGYFASMLDLDVLAPRKAEAGDRGCVEDERSRPSLFAYRRSKMRGDLPVLVADSFASPANDGRRRVARPVARSLGARKGALCPGNDVYTGVPSDILLVSVARIGQVRQRRTTLAWLP